MAELSTTTQDSYSRLAEWLAARLRSHTGPAPVVGVNGAQGSGKSTCSYWLSDHLARNFGLNVAVLSLDDFYLTRAERQTLASTVHPLLATRGVPGTHDVALAMAKIQELRASRTGQQVMLPSFDKAIDDRRPLQQGTCVDGPVDVILFEGWCVGVPAQTPEALKLPINTLEQDEDPQGDWRRYVNDQLAGEYAQWFGMLDALVLLAVPGWEPVFTWRSQQERETAASNPNGVGVMDDRTLRRFMEHYERLTRHALTVLPDLADVVLSLDLAHSVRVEKLT